MVTTRCAASPDTFAQGLVFRAKIAIYMYDQSENVSLDSGLNVVFYFSIIFAPNSEEYGR